MSRGEYIVSGPGTEGKSAPTAPAALSLAQTLACRATDDATWYVRDASGTIRFHVTRSGRTVVTARASTAPEARQPAEPQTMKEAIA